MVAVRHLRPSGPHPLLRDPRRDRAVHPGRRLKGAAARAGEVPPATRYMTRMTNGDRPTSPPALDSLTAGVQSAAEKGRRPSTSGIPPIAARSTCASRPTAPGTTWARPSAARRWCGCSPPFCARIPSATCSSRRSSASASSWTTRRSWRWRCRSRTTRPGARCVSEPMSMTGPPRTPPIRSASSGKPPGGLKPYVLVRGELWARVARAVFYDLAALGEERDVDGVRMFGVASAGIFFPMAPASELAGIEGPDPELGPEPEPGPDPEPGR